MIAPKRPNSADDIMSAAHHCLAAENFFARAKEIHEQIADVPRKPSRFHRRLLSGLKQSYETHLTWARVHLQMAEVITLGSGVVMAHSRATSTLDPRGLSRDVAREAACWDEFLSGQPRDGRERWLAKPDPADAEY